MTRRGLFASALSIRVNRATGEEKSRSGLMARPRLAYYLRQRTAELQSRHPVSAEIRNGDETALPNWISCFTKGLPHNQLGEVESGAFTSLLAAITSGKHADFERIPKGAGRKLSNPEAAFAFQLEGGDSHRFSIPPAPSITSPEAATETAELYWQALCRDVSFSDYEKSPLIQQAADDMRGAPATLFRGLTKGELQGPYISQFLWKPIPYGCSKLDQRYRLSLPGSDFMTAFGEWHQIQSGIPPWRQGIYDDKPHYIRNGRDLAECVHYDFPYQVSSMPL